MIYELVDKLVSYGIKMGLLQESDAIYARNKLLFLLKNDTYESTTAVCQNVDELPMILKDICDYAAQNHILDEDTFWRREQFEAELMDALMPRPSSVISRFSDLYADSPEKATDYFYRLSQDSYYIKRDRIARDIRWSYRSEYGELEITINRSKPEKDPREIAAAKQAPASSYPKCQLCVENMGYSGRINHPARQNHRLIPVTIADEDWSLQYSPYVYYNEHCIVLNNRHIPMVIDGTVFKKLLDFVEQFPHYMVGSNADLPIVGGSILSHEHFQGGRHTFALQKAECDRTYTIKDFEDVAVGRVNWPMSVIRLQSKNRDRLEKLASHIFESWKGYSDASVYVLAETNGERHNTITPIAYHYGETYVLDLLLRNNITTKEHPYGLYHPHEELHHIKKENIGLIEAIGLAVLPGRLAEELDAVAKALVDGADLAADEKTARHKDWAETILQKYLELDETNVSAILKEEVGKVFSIVLEHAGVFKRNQAGFMAFDQFMNQL